VRHQNGFPSLEPEQSGLVELSCVEAAGFLWACPDPDALNVFPDAGSKALLSELEGFGCDEGVVFETESRVWKANWKLIVDGGLESYHFKVAHRNTVGGFFADNISTFQFLGEHIRTVLPRVSVAELADRPESEWNIREHSHLVYAIFPNATVLMQEGHFELIIMTPLSVDETRVEIATVVPAPGPGGHSGKEQAFWSANHAFTKATLNEDFELAEQIQRGVESGANEVFRFGRFEGALSRWHEMLDAKLGR
jgi:phenylpropionate dioxygenase-like ring-hydroxylating dioxygenase large terminal subunit